MVVSPEDLETVGDKTPHLATVGANSSASSAAPVLRALAQLSETMIMLAGEGEMGHARVVHEATGRLLTPSSELPDVRTPRRCEPLKIGVALQADIRQRSLTEMAPNAAVQRRREALPAAMPCWAASSVNVESYE